MSRTQYKIYLAIKSYINKIGYSPTLSELKEMTNLKSEQTVQYNLKKLRSLGYISYDDKKARTIKIKREYICTYDKSI